MEKIRHIKMNKINHLKYTHNIIMTRQVVSEKWEREKKKDDCLQFKSNYKDYIYYIWTDIIFRLGVQLKYFIIYKKKLA